MDLSDINSNLDIEKYQKELTDHIEYLIEGIPESTRHTLRFSTEAGVYSARLQIALEYILTLKKQLKERD